MKIVRSIIDSLYANAFIGKQFKPILDAMDAAMFGTKHTTRDGPHIVDHIEMKRYMTMVILGLMPAALASIYYYGMRAILMIAVSYAVGGLVEVVFAMVRKHDIHEGFLVTGLIFPLTLPPGTPLWIVGVGVFFGVFFGKEVFGGTGRNLFNPALVGRLFVTVAFPGAMTTSYMVPLTDSITSATPLGVFKSSHVLTSVMDLLSGQATGSLGETFRLGIIVGGLFLLFTKVGNWRIPVMYILSVFVFSAVGSAYIPLKIAPPQFQILAGGLLYGAFFMATDPVTSPVTKAGKYIFGILCGFLTVLIRSFSGYVEGVMFSIVLMNALSPLLDHLVIQMQFKPVTK